MAHDFTVMLAVHDAVRRDLIRLVSLVGGTAPISDTRASALARQWDLIVGRVREHERIEDEVLWPAVRVAVPADEQDPLDRMVAAHQQLTAVLQAASDRLAAGDLAHGRGARARLADSIEAAAVLADAQFAFEERVVLPLLDRFLPGQDWADFVAASHAPTGPLADPVVLPWLLEGSRPQRVATVLALLGPENRRAYEQDWKPAYRVRVAQVW